MYAELSQMVSWNPPEELRRDCKIWWERCKVCMATHRKPKDTTPMGTIREWRPFARFQVDLMEVLPKGENGETHIFTCICVATRYIFLRTTTTRDTVELALLMLDVLLDCGIVPLVIQSDNEFLTLAFEELFSLLGSSQLFSTALRPQSQGIVERSHRDIRAALSVLVESYTRSNPRRWVQYLRYIEHKLRHKPNQEGITPYMLVHGYAGSTILSTAMGGLVEIPVDHVHGDWLRHIISEAKKMNAETEESWYGREQKRLKNARQHEEEKPPDTISVGDLVLLHKSYYERGLGYILPKCDGPFQVSDRPTAHTARLADALTAEPYQHGKPVSVARLVKYSFPADHSLPLTEQVDVSGADKLASLRLGSMVAVNFEGRVHVAKVDRILPEDESIVVVIYEVPRDNRFGPWSRRIWSPLVRKSETVKELIYMKDVLTLVTLTENALSADSLEALAALGIGAFGATEHREKALGGRRM